MILIISIFFFTTCDNGNTTDNGSNITTNDITKLTIKNESGYEFTNVLWNGASFSSIKPGKRVTMTVKDGNGYIRFNPKLNPFNMRTEQIITIEKNEQKEFVFLNSSVVVNDSTNSNGILATFAGQIWGPGGGILFYAESGQYKECGGELGLYKWNDAKTKAENFNGANFNDWYLPNKSELDLIYQNMHKNGLGGFTDRSYWSSSEYDNLHAWIQYFSDGHNRIAVKESNICQVLAVRTFSSLTF